MKYIVFLVGQSGERHSSSGYEAVQEALLAISEARFVPQFFSDDFWYNNIVGDGRENSFAVGAGVEVDQNTRIENQRSQVISQGA